MPPISYATLRLSDRALLESGTDRSQKKKKQESGTEKKLCAEPDTSSVPSWFHQRHEAVAANDLTGDERNESKSSRGEVQVSFSHERGRLDLSP